MTHGKGREYVFLLIQLQRYKTRSGPMHTPTCMHAPCMNHAPRRKQSALQIIHRQMACTCNIRRTLHLFCKSNAVSLRFDFSCKSSWSLFLCLHFLLCWESEGIHRLFMRQVEGDRFTNKVKNIK